MWDAPERLQRLDDVVVTRRRASILRAGRRFDPQRRHGCQNASRRQGSDHREGRFFKEGRERVKGDRSFRARATPASGSEGEVRCAGL
jgi:hypothetical protein